MKLYRAICEWFESMTLLNLVQAESIAEGDTPRPEGATSQVEFAHGFTSEPELHNGWRPNQIEWDDRSHISLRYHPPGE